MPDLTVPPLDQWRDKVPITLHATKPDYVVFVPEVSGQELTDTGNEHFLVFDGPKKSLLAIWTQSTREGEPDQHIVFSRRRTPRPPGSRTTRWWNSCASTTSTSIPRRRS